MTDRFETVDAPKESKAGRKPLPNPFKDPDVFPTPEGEARSVLVEEGRNSTRANRLVRQARQAAKDLGLTARVQVNEGATSTGLALDGDTVQLLFWTVERVGRKDDE